METLDIFLFVSSIVVGVVGIQLSIALYRLNQILKTLEKISHIVDMVHSVATTLDILPLRIFRSFSDWMIKKKD